MDTWSLVLKALHLIAMVTWFAALFYLPRLFVYHAMLDREAEPAANERFKVMERRLLKGIMTPSLIAIWVFGIWMLIDYAWGMYGKMGWLHAKLTLVVILSGYHGWCARIVKDFAADRNKRSHKWYRFFNEAPTLLLLAIVFLAVLKPF